MTLAERFETWLDDVATAYSIRSEICRDVLQNLIHNELTPAEAAMVRAMREKRLIHHVGWENCLCLNCWSTAPKRFEGQKCSVCAAPTLQEKTLGQEIIEGLEELLEKAKAGVSIDALEKERGE